METKKTHWKKVFNKDYLGSHDLDEGKDLVVTINHIEIREIKDSSGKPEKRNVAIFGGNIKPMVLNVTNCKTIKAFSGSNYIEEWKGIAITIYSKQIKAFGEEMEALRIRDKQPNIEKDKLTPNHNMWTKAIEHLQKPNSTIDDILKRYDVTPDNVEKLQEAAI